MYLADPGEARGCSTISFVIIYQTLAMRGAALQSALWYMYLADPGKARGCSTISSVMYVFSRGGGGGTRRFWKCPNQSRFFSPDSFPIGTPATPFMTRSCWHNFTQCFPAGLAAGSALHSPPASGRTQACLETPASLPPACPGPAVSTAPLQGSGTVKTIFIACPLCCVSIVA